MVDKQCIDLKSGAFLFGDTHVKKVQSNVHYFPIKVIFAKNMKDLDRVEYPDICYF